MIYYIGDTHFGDKRVMELAGRPYSSTIEMDNDIVFQWNSRVKADDTVYILGDFAFDDVSAQIVEKLHGKKILVLGNHDEGLSLKTLRKFDNIKMIETIDDCKRSVCLCHYPLLSYNNSVYGGYHVFGHIHNNTSDKAYLLQSQLSNSFNCGADIVGFTPRTLDELIAFQKEGKL